MADLFDSEADMQLHVGILGVTGAYLSDSEADMQLHIGIEQLGY